MTSTSYPVNIFNNNNRLNSKIAYREIFLVHTMCIAQTQLQATAKKWMLRYLEESRPVLLKNGEDTDAVFVSIRKKRLSIKMPSEVIKGYIQKSGLREQGGCHMFRHAAATHMMNNDCDIRILMELLGHRSINSTQIYTTVAIDKLREVHKKTHPSG